MKIRSAISLPQELFSEVDDVVREREEPRSSLIAAALKAYIGFIDSERLTRQFNEAYADDGLSSEERAWLDRAARLTFERIAADEEESW